jgi:hypothetical protein
MFRGATVIHREIEAGGARLVRSEPVTLPDGRAAMVLELSEKSGRALLTVDAETDLLVSWETYSDGKLRAKIERIEYNVEIPDSVFQPAIPEGAIVVDATDRQASAEQRARYAEWLAAAKRLSGAYTLNQIPPGGHVNLGTPFHHHLMFETLDTGGLILLYLPDRNVYRVFGRAMVHEDGDDRNAGPVVENAEYVPPTPAEVTVEQVKAKEARELAESQRRMPTPEMRAKWDAKGKELAAAGAKQLCTGGSFYPRNNLAFDPLNERYISVWYSPARSEYYVMGKARVHGRFGFEFDQTVEDGWIKVPGPPPELNDE